MTSESSESLTPRILLAVRRIPRGQVASYGEVAESAGLPRRARLVGKVLGSLPDGSTVPWHRVVNAAGRISPRGAPDAVPEQRRRLEREGVRFTPSGRVVFGRPEEGPPPGKNRVSRAARRR